MLPGAFCLFICTFIHLYHLTPCDLCSYFKSRVNRVKLYIFFKELKDVIWPEVAANLVSCCMGHNNATAISIGTLLLTYCAFAAVNHVEIKCFILKLLRFRFLSPPLFHTAASSVVEILSFFFSQTVLNPVLVKYLSANVSPNHMHYFHNIIHLHRIYETHFIIISLW